MNAIAGLDAELLAIDPHDAWPAKHLLKEVGLQTSDLKFPLLLDANLLASAAYGVAFQMRIHTEWSNRPATFIVDKKGILRYARRARTYSDRPRPSDVVGELKKLRAP